MKRFGLYIICFISFSVAFAQEGKQHSIPDVAKITAEHRWDSLHQWYTNNITYSNAKRKEKQELLTEALAYAERSNDPIIECSVLFLWGFFELGGDSIQGIQGLADINKACDIADKNGLYYEWAIFIKHLGLYYESRSTGKSLEYLMRADEAMKRIGRSETAAGRTISLELGNTMWYLGNYRGCLDVLIPLGEILEQTDDGKGTRVTLNNSIGLAYREMKQTDSALFYFRKALALSTKDSAWPGIILGNITAAYIAEHRLDSGLVYARRYYQWMKDNPGEPDEMAGSLILLSDVYVELHHKPDTVLPMLLEAERILEGMKKGRMGLMMYSMLADIYHKKGNHKAAENYLQKALALQDNHWKSYTLESYIKGQEQLEAEKSIRKIKEVENAIQLSVQRRNFFIIGLCLLGLILYTLYRRQQYRSKRNRELFESREQLLFLEKKRAEENLQSYMENLQEKNRLIEHVEREIELLDENSSDKHEMFETLNNLKRISIITNDDWEHFKTLFEKAYHGFFARLKEKFPDITPAEMRLMALIKLDIPMRKMADMLGVSYETIRKTKYRFVKKLNAPETTDLSEIVNSL